MRDIKFRAWDNEEHCMVHNFEMYQQHERKWIDNEGLTETDNSLPVSTHWSYYEEAPELELMQYTGLHDKNGEEIYEGDILRYKDGITSIEFNVREVSWFASNDNANLRYIVDFGGEIIGNIYESPELLETKE